MTLTEKDRYLVAAALQVVVLHKRENLGLRSWTEFSEVWLPKALDQLEQNDFVVNHPKRNFFTWFQDQIGHVDIPIDFMEGFTQPFSETEIGQQVLEICDKARLGQRHYDRWRTQDLS